MKNKKATTSSVSCQCVSNLLLVQEFIQHRVHVTKRKNTVDYFSEILGCHVYNIQVTL